MEKSYTYLSLGSNSGERLKVIEEAISMISEKIGPVTDRSPVYETEPWGFNDPVPFLNLVIKVQTDLVPETVLQECLSIENSLGRIRVPDSGYTSRIIDIDVIFYDDLVINESNIEIPHPRMHLRKFVLMPLNDISPDFIHPVLGKTVSDLLGECDDPGRIVLF